MCHVLEDVCALADVEKIRAGETLLRRAAKPVVLPKHHEPVRLVVRERAQEHAFDDAEDCGVGAHTEGEGGEHDESKAWALRKRT